MACPALFSSFFPSKNLMHSKTSEQQHGILKKKKKQQHGEVNFHG
jgi:hypothetical protein